VTLLSRIGERAAEQPLDGAPPDQHLPPDAQRLDGAPGLGRAVEVCQTEFAVQQSVQLWHGVDLLPRLTVGQRWSCCGLETGRSLWHRRATWQRSLTSWPARPKCDAGRIAGEISRGELLEREKIATLDVVVQLGARVMHLCGYIGLVDPHVAPTESLHCIGILSPELFEVLAWPSRSSA
jgi:hypothetical protein